MRRGKWFTHGFVATVVILTAAFAVVAADVKDEFTIKAGLWATPTKAAVPFTHKKHVEVHKVACTDCHHVFKDGKNVWKEGDEVQKCEACHTNAVIQGEAQLPPDQKVLNLKLAFHNNCQGCHKKAKAENKESKAPTTCTQCHPAEQK
jgi:NAD-dependent SIR2 family protein deacetylase